jgi:hypothetical protein
MSAGRDEGRFTERPTAEQIAHALGGARREGDGLRCHCPAHDDHDPSLSVIDRDGRVPWERNFVKHRFPEAAYDQDETNDL